jgi:hypothetical protein
MLSQVCPRRPAIPRLAKAVAHSKILVHNVKRSSYVL